MTGRRRENRAEPDGARFSTMETLNPFHVAFSPAAEMLTALDPKARLEMYRRARQTVAEAAESAADPQVNRDLLRQARELENGIRAVEGEIRARRAAPQPAPAEAAPSGGEEPLFPYVGPSAPVAAPRRRLLQGLSDRAARIEALVWRFARLTAAGGPLAYLWLVIEPAIPIAFVIMLYLVLGRAEIFDMPTPAFVVLGIGAWFLYRAIFMRLSVGHGAEVQLLRLPRISEFDLYASKALFYAVIYAVMIFAVIGALVAVGAAEKPDRLLTVLGLMFCLVIIGFSHGLIFLYLAGKFPPLMRIKMILLRVIYITSGAMYVSEQFPDAISDFLLYNPFLHIIQLIRDAYFSQYETHAASMTVVIAFTLISAALGVACLRVARRAPRSL